jgi:hypothetical protein
LAVPSAGSVGTTSRNGLGLHPTENPAQNMIAVHAATKRRDIVEIGAEIMAPPSAEPQQLSISRG